MPSACLLALTTIIAAFQRTKARMRRSMCSSPGNHGSCSRGIVLTYGRRDGGREADLALLGPLEQLGQQVAGPGLAAVRRPPRPGSRATPRSRRDRCRGSDGRSRRRSWSQVSHRRRRARAGAFPFPGSRDPQGRHGITTIRPHRAALETTGLDGSRGRRARRARRRAAATTTRPAITTEPAVDRGHDRVAPETTSVPSTEATTTTTSTTVPPTTTISDGGAEGPDRRRLPTLLAAPP